MNNEKKIILEKDKPILYLSIFIISLFLPIFMIAFMYYHDFNDASVITGIIASPVFVYLMRYGYKMFLVVDKNIIISQSGITIEDYREKEFKWPDIAGFSTQDFTPETVDKHCYLYLKVSNINEINPDLLKDFPEVKDEGFPVCDLARYKEKKEVIEALIEQHLNKTEYAIA